jgi:hypothetical protein
MKSRACRADFHLRAKPAWWERSVTRRECLVGIPANASSLEYEAENFYHRKHSNHPTGDRTRINENIPVVVDRSFAV